MGLLTRMAPLLALASAIACGADAPGDALAIMKKMAENTAAATEARRQYVYRQRIRAGLLHSNGQVVCRETREYTVVPQAKTTKKKLESFHGECREGKDMVPYAQPGEIQPGLQEKGTTVEVTGRESIAGLVAGLADNPKSRDGIPRQLFPLSSEELASYRFKLKGETTIQGRRAYDITFAPFIGKGNCVVGEDTENSHAIECRPWKGEVWVDAEDYQPIRIDTELAKGIPWGVRVFMGINLRQLGFSLTYRRAAEGVWFPATYGTEFRVTVFWGYKRTITMSMENSDFRKTDAQSTIEFDDPDK